MTQNKQASTWRDVVKRSSELLILSFTIIGLGAIIFSIVLKGRVDPQWIDILRALGLTFFPSGIVSFMLARFASDNMELAILDTVKRTMGDRLERHVERITDDVTQQMKLGLGTIHERVDGSLDEIEREVGTGLQVVNEEMAKLSPLHISCTQLGVQGVYLTRSEALLAFAWFLDAEITKALERKPARIWFVSSSIKGFLTTAMGDFDGRTMMSRIAKSGCDLRIMMTDPTKADSRAAQEGRAEGEIPGEISMNLASLKRMGVSREHVKFYPGVPTVFGIATSERMLLNPYPYETEAFRCFSLIVYKTIDPSSDIYNQYLEFHFELPWNQRAEEVPMALWNGLR